MSHASVVVALSKAIVEVDGLETALEWQMEPFSENRDDGGWFADGTRWDWYQIGGRYTGNLDGYDPYADPANEEICKLCAGTGIRPNGKQQFGEDWFIACNGCNGCHGKGKSTALQLKHHRGDILPVAAVLELGKFKSAYAFLSNRHWHEAERLGWFGVSTMTECERKDLEKPIANPDNWFGKCLHRDEKTGAQIVCWNEPGEIWDEQFVRRFLRPLPSDTILVNVDYHV